VEDVLAGYEKAVHITLTAFDMSAAEAHSQAVIASAKQEGYAHKFQPEDELAVNTMGYAAETAAARATGLSGPHREVLHKGYRHDEKRPDIGTRTDVKATPHHDGHLVLHKGDKREFVFLLVTGKGPEFTVVGWMEGRDAMVPRYWRTSGRLAAWWVPQSSLHPLPLPTDA
jgi:hypothetical protein